MKQTCGECENFDIYDNVIFGACNIDVPSWAERVSFHIDPDYNADGCKFYTKKIVTCGTCYHFKDKSSRELRKCSIKLPACVTDASITVSSTVNATSCYYYEEKQ